MPTFDISLNIIVNWLEQITEETSMFFPYVTMGFLTKNLKIYKSTNYVCIYSLYEITFFVLKNLKKFVKVYDEIRKKDALFSLQKNRFLY